MARSSRFEAPWSLSLRLSTMFSVLVLVGVAAAGLLTGPRQMLIWQLSMVALPLFILIASVPFIIRRYRLEGDELLVDRLGWTTRVPLAGLREVAPDPEAMKRSIRTFGNGGLFCFAGHFRNRHLGAYRAWATDPARATVPRFADRVVVVTPEDPRRFERALREVTGL